MFCGCMQSSCSRPRSPRGVWERLFFGCPADGGPAAESKPGSGGRSQLNLLVRGAVSSAHAAAGSALAWRTNRVFGQPPCGCARLFLLPKCRHAGACLQPASRTTVCGTASIECNKPARCWESESSALCPRLARTMPPPRRRPPGTRQSPAPPRQRQPPQPSPMHLLRSIRVAASLWRPVAAVARGHRAAWCREQRSQRLADLRQCQRSRSSLQNISTGMAVDGGRGGQTSGFERCQGRPGHSNIHIRVWHSRKHCSSNRNCPCGQMAKASGLYDSLD